MQVFNRGAELSAALGNEKVLTGFVPTMGALHEGHAVSYTHLTLPTIRLV